MPRITLAIAAVLAVTLPAVSAQAQGAIRTYVSITGSDSNPCSLTAPCRHFQAAVNATSAGGEVDALDPGGYGALTIGQAVTIDGEGWSYVAPGPSGVAISVNASSGNVVLRGLSLNGVGVTGSIGIAFNGASLNVQNCVIQNFSLVGIDFSPASASHLSVLDTLVSGNGINGIQISPTGSALVVGIISRVTMEGNGSSGLIVSTPGDGSIQVTVSDSVSENNTSIGLSASANGGTAKMMVRNSTIANNGVNGLEADYAGATIWFSRTTITGNGTGWFEYMSGVVATFGTNEIVGNNNVNNPPSSSVGLE